MFMKTFKIDTTKDGRSKVDILLEIEKSGSTCEIIWCDSESGCKRSRLLSAQQAMIVLSNFKATHRPDRQAAFVEKLDKLSWSSYYFGI